MKHFDKIKLMKKILFIDRDGTLIKEAPPTYQLDSFSKLEFYPEVFHYLGKIAAEFDYEFIMVTNQDGLGTASFPEEHFWPLHRFVIKAFANENIYFRAIHIDRTFPADHAPTRKPGIGMLTGYLNNPQYDINRSFVIGDRITDMQLAKNLGCKGIWLNNDAALGGAEIADTVEALRYSSIVLETTAWKDIYEFLLGQTG